MLSFHRCIAPTDNFADDTYLNNLELRGRQRELLRSVRVLVRETLRTAFQRETAAFFGDEKPISPNFFTQGSWGYKTINRPTHVPPQQTDMDDGCYLPMTFVRGTNPKRAASWFCSASIGMSARCFRLPPSTEFSRSRSTKRPPSRHCSDLERNSETSLSFAPGCGKLSYTLPDCGRPPDQ